MNLLVGTAGHDLLDVRTASGGYEIQGLAGSDTIFGSAYADLIVPGTGDNQSWGFDGDDIFLITVTGLAGDLVTGGNGFDTIIAGTAGDDVLRFTTINSIERIDGGGGNDVLVGYDMGNFWNFSQTQLIGIVEIDLRGGNDQITGSAGNERIIGGAGNDILDGGAGFDTAVYSGDFAVYTLTPQADGSLWVATTANTDGTDTIRRFEIVEFANGTYANGVFTPFGGPNTPPTADPDSFSQGEDTAASNVTATLLAGDGDPDTADVLRVNAVNTAGTVGTVILTNAGLTNATVTYQAGAAHNALGAGQSATDTFQYTLGDGQGGTSTATVTVTVNGANDAPTADNDSFSQGEDAAATNVTATLLAGDSDPDVGDVLRVNAVNTAGTVGTVILTNAGLTNATVTYQAGAAHNALGTGQSATDTFQYTLGDGQGGTSTATVTVTVNGANDAPTVANPLLDQGAVAGVAFGYTFAAGSFSDVDAGDVLGYTATRADGSPLPGWLSFSAGTRSFSGTAGAGDAGLLSLRVTATDSQGAAVSDVFELNVAAGGTVINGTANSETLNGTAGNDTLNGLGGNDTLNGLDGNDILNGGAGIDTMNGGAGDDSIVFAGIDGLNYDVVNGGTGFDQILGGAGDDIIRLWNYSGANTVEKIDGGGGLNLIVAVANFSTVLDFTNTQLVNIARIEGGAGNDTIIGTVEADVIVGGAGIDNMGGGGGDDTFQIIGIDASYDVVNGGAGLFDRILGSAGDDTFRLWNYSGANTVELIDGGTGLNVIAAVANFGTVLDFTNTQLLNITRIEGGSAADTITGGAANDTILGAAGNDALDGAAGTDTAVYSGDFAAYTLTLQANGSLRVAATANSDGTDTIRNFEIVEFANGTYANGVFTPFGGPNTAPTADNDSFSQGEDAAATNVTATLLAGDSDPDTADVLRVNAVNTAGTVGTVILTNAGLTNATVTYQAGAAHNALGAGQSATDTFQYTLGDGQGGTSTATVTVTVNGANDAPSADNDSLSQSEDAAASNVTATLLAGDSDPDTADVLRVNAVNTAGTVGTVILTNAGLTNATVTYQAGAAHNALGAGQSATDTFQYTLGDGQGGTSTATVTVTINGANDAPTADNDSFSQGEDAAATNVTATLLAGDSDPDTADVLRVNAVNTAGTVGTVILTNAGLTNATVTYQAGAAHNALGTGQSATDTFQYTLGDGQGGTSTATVTVTINGANDAPSADNDSFSQGEDTAATNVTATLLAGDSDPDTADVLRVNAVNIAGTVGTVILTNAGLTNATVTYQAGAAHNALGTGQSATDTFQYTLGDGNGGTSTATVTVTINGANDAPSADNDSFSQGEDAAASNVTATLLAGDSDPDVGDVLRVNAVNTAGTVGTVILTNAGLTNATVTYQAGAAHNALGAGQSATDTFQYTLGDGQGGTSTATVTVTVNGANDAPTVANPLLDQGATAGVAFGYTFGAGSFSDVDAGDALLYGATLANGDPLPGWLSFSAGTRSFSGTAGAGDAGLLSLRVTATDSQGAAVSDVFELNVAAGGTVINGTANSETLNGTAGNDTLNGLGGNDTLNGLDGNDILNGGAGIDTMNGGAGDDSIVFAGIDGLNYDVVNGGTGFDQILGGAGDDIIRLWNYSGANTVEKIDGGGGLNLIVAVANFSTVLDFTNTQLVNIARIEGGAGNDTIIGTVEADVIVGGAGIDNMGGGGGDDTFQIIGIDASYDVVNGGAGLFDRILGSAGDDTFRLWNYSGANTVELIDGGTGLNVIAAVANFGTVLDFTNTQLLNITRIEGGSAADTITGGADNDRILGAAGNDALDGGAGSNTAVYSGDFAAYTLTPQADGSLRVATTANSDGTDTIRNFEIVEFANGTYANGVFTPFGGPNTAPVAVSDSYAATEDTALVVNTASSVLANDTDADNDPLMVSGFSAQSAQGGTVAMNADGSFTYTPVANFNGSDSFTYTAADGQGGTATATVTLTVAAVNDVPVAANNAYTATEDTALIVAVASGVLANDTDADGDSLTVSGFSAQSAQGGTVAMNADGSFTYTPVANFNGSDSFTYTAADGQGGTATATATVNVAAVNDVPVAVNNSYAATEDTPLVVQVGAGVLANDTDADNDPLTVSGFSAQSAQGGSVAMNPDGSFTYTPVASFNGSDSFTYTASDGQGGTATATVTVTVSPPYTLLVGTAGHDLLDARQGTGGYEIQGLAGNDTIFGSEYADLIVGGSGDNQMWGFGGDDVFLVTGGPAGENVDGGNGFDTIIAGTAGNDVLRFRNIYFIERIDGGGGNDALVGYDGGNFWDFSQTQLIGIVEIDLQGGSDQITGSAGNERIIGGAGNDVLDGGAGFDTVVFSGTFAVYTLTPQADGSLWVATTANTDGSDTIRNFEIVEFVNGTYANGVFTPYPDPNNTAPQAAPDLYAATEDTALAVNAVSGVLANDTDPDNDLLYIWSFDAQSAQGGAVAMNANGSFTYTPAVNFNGSDSFSYTAADGRGGYSAAAVTLTVGAVDDVPVALNNMYTAAIDTPLVVNAASGVLVNDSDPEGMPLTVASYDALSTYGGTVAMNADGSFTYTPAAGFTGADSFSYAASDGNGQDAATVTLLVREPQPDAPEFEAIIANLPEGEWARVNTNQYQDVWTPADQRPFEYFGGTPISIINAWSSAAWDDQRSEYIFWGGGHANYEGNEVYTWSAVTLQWERASLPSAIALQPPGQFETVDGYQNSPISSHAYDNTEYLKIADRMIDFGGASAHAGKAFVETDNVTRTGPYFWDPSKADPNKVGGLTGSQVNAAEHPEVVGGEMWENRETWKTGPVAGQMVNGTTDYVLMDGVDVVFVNPGSDGLYTYTVPDVNDPSQDSWAQVGTVWDAYNGSGAGAYDPDHNLYVRTSTYSMTFWDLDTAGPGNRNMNFTPTDPTGEFVLSADWGMEYDPVRGHFVLWDGNASVWYLQPPVEPGPTGWTLEKAPAPELAAPVEQLGFLGVLGKWDYVEKYDVFIGVTHPVTGDVWVYKPEGWTPGDWLL